MINKIMELISKFDSDGTHLWAKRLGSSQYEAGYDITSDSNNYVTVVGYVFENSDLNGDGDSSDGGAEDFTNYGNYDIFISQFDSSGNHRWAKRIGGIDYYDDGYAIATYPGDYLILTGNVELDADLTGDGDFLDSGEDSTGYGGIDIFITKFDPDGNF